MRVPTGYLPSAEIAVGPRPNGPTFPHTSHVITAHVRDYQPRLSESLYQKTDPPRRMPAGTPDDWQLIARTLTAATHEDCRCYDGETIDEQPVPVGNQERLVFVPNR